MCEQWWRDPTVNPRTGRKIKVNGPTYKQLLAECGEPPKTPKSAQMSFEQIAKMYRNIAGDITPSNPLKRNQILLKFHPDKLPPNVKVQMAKYPKISLFANRAFHELKNKGQVTSRKALDDILTGLKSTLVQTPEQKRPKAPDPPQRQVTPPPPRPTIPITFDEIKNIYKRTAGDITPANPLTREKIMQKFLSLNILLPQMDKYPHVEKFVFEAYLEMYQRSPITSVNEFDSLLESFRNGFKPEHEKTKYELVLTFGLGCNTKVNETMVKGMVQQIIKENNITNINSITLQCDNSTMNVIKNIAKTACYMRPAKNDKFVMKTVSAIRELLDAGKHVIMIGHSYGGAVNSLVAHHLNNHPRVKNLQIATLGSIYIAPKSDISNIRMKQYMMLNDIALRCAKVAPPKQMGEFYDDPGTGVTWVRPNPNKKSRWEIHGSYYDLMEKIIGKQDVNVFF